MTRLIPSLALVTLAAPALAHPGHEGGTAHWLSGDHLAMLGALAALGGALAWRGAARVRIRSEDEDRREMH
jgi:hydrogenase/urease accessory protein HupE